jgi:pimeloyl-ACP methyl ester carboxylesterase
MAYAPVNGTDIYYEVHGGRTSGIPLVLLHGSLSTIDTSFGAVLPALAATRAVIAAEFRGHGHSPKGDRPLTHAQLADDTIELLRHLGIDQADLFGYSLGSAIAVETVLRQPALVRKLALASVCYHIDGFVPGVLDGIDTLDPADLAGTPWHQAYLATAPDADDWPSLVADTLQLDRNFTGWPAATIQSISAPTLIINGDADIVRPEHAIEMFRLLGPTAQVAVLPGTTHEGLVDRADLLLPIVTSFVDAAAAAAATSMGDDVAK